MKFEYPIKATYVQDWHVLHALREVIANALDAEVTLGAAKTIHYDVRRKLVRVVSHEVTLDREVLLFGGSTKSGQAALIGQYGEGLKLALLVLAREGYKTRIRNGRHESWTPTIEHSEKWGSEVLTLDIRKTDRQDESFEVEVEGITGDTWEAVKGLFLCLAPSRTFDTPQGQILLDATHVGAVYVKGVKVTFVPNYVYGYNFKNLHIGRDRSIPARWDMDGEIARMLTCLAATGEQKTREVVKLLEGNLPEGEVLRYHHTDTLLDALAADFADRYGEGVVPCGALAECESVRHLGGKGVAVTPLYAELLQKRLTGPAAYGERAKSEVLRTYGPEDLSAVELAHFHEVVRLVEAVSPRAGARISVVDFRDPLIEGLHAGSEVRLAQRLLVDFGKTLFVTLHELAHDEGGDGTFGHVSGLHRLTEGVMNQMHKETRDVQAGR